MISLMMCDDHVGVRDAILQILQNNHGFNVCGRATTGKECIALIESGTIPDLLILDIRMPEMSGYEVAKYLRKNFPQIKIFVFSIIDDYEAVKAMIRIKVNGFAFKEIDAPEISEIIHLIMSGKEYYPPKFFFTPEQIQEIKNTPIPWAEHITEREMTAVKLLANNLSRKQAASEMGISNSVLNKKVENVFKKIGHNTTIAAVKFLKDLGVIK